MSRSRRRSPCLGITTAATDKPFKRVEHRRERREVRQRLGVGDEPRGHKLFGNPWSGPKDGKQWWPDMPQAQRRK